MPRIAYAEEKKFQYRTLLLMQQADRIATDYKRRGYNLTLRQLYYQFVSKDLLANTEKNYGKLGRVVNDARMAGLMDWDHITDRGREAHSVNWLGFEPDSQAELIRNAQYQHSLDLWSDQPRRVEVWVEKQALEEVAQIATRNTRSGYLACKGYMSQSEMWAAGRRLQRVQESGQEPLVLHLGDHDPSGMDMTRDIQERLSTFAEFDVEVRRIALNMDQIEQYAPPPNPAKETDSRFKTYRDEYGDESWELDALSPEVLVKLIRDTITEEIDPELFAARQDLEAKGREPFETIADRWDEVVDYFELDNTEDEE